MKRMLVTDFEKLDLPAREISEDARKGYRVYKTPSEFVAVEAAMASEAVEKSGVAHPCKVVRAALEIRDVLEPGMLKPVDSAARVENPRGNA